MSTLREIFASEDRKAVIVRDCCDVLDAEVAEKTGVSGIAVKAGYRTVKGFKPGFIPKVVGDLLPEFADAIEPIYQEARERGEPVADFLARSSSRAAEALLAITDAKADRSTNRVVKGTYKRLRSTAKRNVEAAMPRVGKLIEKHAGE